MTINVILSLAMTATLLISVAGLFLYKMMSTTLPVANVVGADILALTFIEQRDRLSDPVIAGVGWLCLSTLIGFGLPVIYGQGHFILAPPQLISTANYSLTVPILVGAYVFLVRSVGYYDAKSVKNNGKVIWRLKSFWIFQFVLFILTIAIQRQAILSEVSLPSPCSPWVVLKQVTTSVCNPWHPSDAGSDLSVAGVFYYSLRGLDTFMALGLFATIAMTWFNLRKRFDPHKLVDFEFPGLGPSEHVRNVGGGLVSCILFGSIVTALHGLSLFAHANALRPGASRAEDQVRLFTESTWSIWAVLTVVASALAAAIVLWLREEIEDQLRKLQATETVRLVHYEGLVNTIPKTIAAGKLQAEYVEKILNVRGKLAADFAGADKLPLPAGAYAAIGASALSQLVNFGTAVYTFAIANIN